MTQSENGKSFNETKNKKFQHIVCNNILFTENTSRNTFDYVEWKVKNSFWDKNFVVMKTLNCEFYSQILNVLCNPEESIQIMVSSNDLKTVE